MQATTLKPAKVTAAEPTSVKATITANALVDHSLSTPAPDAHTVTAARSDSSPAAPVDPAKPSPPATADMGQTPNAAEGADARASSGGATGAAASPHAASVSPRSLGVDTRNGATVEVDEQEERGEQVDEHAEGEVQGEAEGQGAAPNPRVAQYLQILKEGVQVCACSPLCQRSWPGAQQGAGTETGQAQSPVAKWHEPQARPRQQT